MVSAYIALNSQKKTCFKKKPKNKNKKGWQHNKSDLAQLWSILMALVSQISCGWQ